jgi:cardiolipin synthase
MYNLANQLTFARLASLPLIVLLLYIPHAWAAWACLILYIMGAMTDWLDGWVARRFHQTSALGTFLDPIADKIFIAVILVVLIAIGRIDGLLTLAVLVILARELFVAGLREFLGPKNIKLPVTKLAKWKTASQMVATGALIIAPYIVEGGLIGGAILCVAAALTAITGWDYFRESLPYLRD